ncbi:MAG: hypothetical protein FD163_573 [Hyphomonadaceae bacterium]|nr:MAG: hypothetical protein FD163_573 [Hyphomonadaceae bacterium]
MAKWPRGKLVVGVMGCLLRKAILKVVCVGAAFACATNAHAQSVTIDVQGTLAAACELNIPTTSYNNLNITAAGSQVIPFSVDCNAPFAYALVSANGGLLNAAGLANVVPGSMQFTGNIPYKVTTNFTTDIGTFGDVSLDAATLSAANASPCIAATYSSTCPFAHSGSGAAAQGQSASITINWQQNTGAPLVAGTYSDTLTLTVRVRT